MYYASEENFMSVYLSEKLGRGGDPFVTKEELKKALNDFAKSVYGRSHEDLKAKFSFENLEEISRRFQKKASENRSWLKPCFDYKDDTLYPTYSFCDIEYYDQFNVLRSFLRDYIKPKFVSCHKREFVECSETQDKVANAVADYLTKFYAKEFIQEEVENGRWPNHKTGLSNIFQKDLGKILGLKGTKKYFENFQDHVYFSVVDLMKANGDYVKFSSQKSGTLDFNNLKRITGAFPELDKFNSSGYYEIGKGKFEIEIKGDSVKVNEKKLKFSDPYGEWSDDYQTTKKDLLK